MPWALPITLPLRRSNKTFYVSSHGYHWYVSLEILMHYGFMTFQTRWLAYLYLYKQQFVPTSRRFHVIYYCRLSTREYLQPADDNSFNHLLNVSSTIATGKYIILLLPNWYYHLGHWLPEKLCLFNTLPCWFCTKTKLYFWFKSILKSSYSSTSGSVICLTGWVKYRTN